MNAAHYYCLLVLALFFCAKSRICAYFKVNVNKITLLYFAGILFLQTLNHRKKMKFSIYLGAREILIMSYINLLRGQKSIHSWA